MITISPSLSIYTFFNPNLGGWVVMAPPPPPNWFSLDNSGTVKAVILSNKK